MTASPSADGTLDVAFVFGAHAFDVPAMKDVWDALPGMEVFPQDLPTFARDIDDVRSGYDAAVFYNFHEHDMDAAVRPVRLTEDAYGTAIEAVREIGDEGMGIVALHHGIAAFPGEGEWERMSGIDGESLATTHLDERFRVEVADPDHPITEGLSSFEFHDETYAMAEPFGDDRVLLSAPDAPGMDALAWTREYRDSRVFSYQSGHDAAAFSSSEFRTILARGVHWVAGSPETAVRVE